MRRRTEAKRNAILSVAREIFRKKGYQGTSMSEITEKVGGSKATIYGYFKSKKLLFEAVMGTATLEEPKQKILASDSPIPIVPMENHRQMMLIFQEMLNSTDDMKTTLYRFSRHFISTICQPEFLEIYRLAVESAARSEIGMRFFEAVSMHIIGNIQDYFWKCKDKGELRLKEKDVEIAARHFLSLIRGPVFERHLFCYGKPMPSSEIRRKTRQSVDAFLKIYGVEEKDA